MLIESMSMNGEFVVSTGKRLTTAQAAGRLRVKTATLYAYVSRGLLASERSESGGSTFDPLDVEVFAASRRHKHSTSGASVGRPLMVMDSEVTLLQDDELYYRGVSALHLAKHRQFEDVVEALWNTSPEHEDTVCRFVSRPNVIKAIQKASPRLGEASGFMDRLKLAVLLSGSQDPDRALMGEATVRDAGRQILATMVDSLPPVQPLPPRTASLATRLWCTVSSSEPSASNLNLLNATMVLCLDHDLAISTMAARMAASARADPYSAVGAALNTLDGTMHGAASAAAFEMLSDTMASGRAEAAISAQIAKSRTIPGFGHVVYHKADPRAQYLFQLLRELPEYRDAVTAADRISAVVQYRTPRPINIDLALAVLAIGAGMRADAGELIVAVSRTAGWIAHILEEYAQPSMRLRPESRYTGIPPSR